MNYKLAIDWWDGNHQRNSSFFLVLEADGFDDDGDWSIQGPYLALREGYWSVPIRKQIFLYNKKDSTLDAVLGRAHPWALAILDIARFPLAVGDTGEGWIFREGGGLAVGKCNWAVITRG